MSRSRKKLLLQKCYCGKVAATRTLWTDKNPWRHFASCGPHEGERCDFFEWVDREKCERSTEVIPGLLRRKRIIEVDIKIGADKAKATGDFTRNLEMENTQLLAENKRLKFKIWCTLFAVALLLLMYIASLPSMNNANAADKGIKYAAIAN